jgi:cellulose synthase/poly-beta-1,6-N-acetylglucosamine synthase-like glycosyltransferase
VAYTTVPNNLKEWLNQRLRWNTGGVQTLNKYKKCMLKKGMLGLFIMPYFFLAWVFGILGLSFFIYRVSRYIYVQYLAASYSIEAQTAVLRFSELNLSPTILFFFGMILLTIGIFYNLAALNYSRDESKEFKKENLFNLIIYIFVYLLLYPIVLISSLYKFIRKNQTW